MKQIELCEALGLSRAQVSKLVARGMPTDSVEAAEAWRQRNLDPMMKISHAARKARAAAAEQIDQGPRNPIDAVVFGVLPPHLLDRAALLQILVDSGIEPTPEQLCSFGAELSAHYATVLIRDLGFPHQRLNLPTWLSDDE